MKIPSIFNTGGGFAPSPHGDRNGSLEDRTKILIATVLVAVLMLTSLIFFVGDRATEAEGASSGTCGADLTWSIDASNKLTISGSGEMDNYTAVGPWGNGIEKVEIGEGVTSIGNCAFTGCGSLTDADISDTVTSIGSEAFKGCTSLKFVSMESGITSIGSEAFYGCIKLNVIMPTGRAQSGDFILPDTVESIGSQAFYGCVLMKTINIPSSLTKIDVETFYGCTGLTEVTMPRSVTSIELRAFGSCSSLEFIYIGSSVSSIGDYAFAGCTKLTEIVFPDSLESISTSSFPSHTFYGTDGSTELAKNSGALKGSTFKGDDVDRMIKQGAGPAPVPDAEPDDQPPVVIPDDSDDYIPWHVPVQRTEQTSDDTSQVVAIVGAIAALLAIIVFLLYWRDD